MYLHIQEGLRCYTKGVYVIYLFPGIEIARNEEHETLLRKIQNKKGIVKSICLGWIFKFVKVWKEFRKKGLRIKWLFSTSNNVWKKSSLILEGTAIPMCFKCESTKQHCYRNVNSITS